MEPERTWDKPCCRFDDQILQTELMSRGIRVRREDAVAVIKTLMVTGKMACFNWYYSKYGPIAMFVAILMFMTLIVIMANLNTPFIDDEGNLGPVVVGRQLAKVPIWTILGFPILYFIPRYLMNKSMTRTMVEVNKILAKYHILATVTDEYRGITKPVLHFVYYERGSCLLQIQEDLMARATQDSSSVEVNIEDNFSDPVVPEDASSSAVCVEMSCTDLLLSGERGDTPGTDVHKNNSSSMSEFKAEADALLLKYSDMYVRLLVNKNLPQPRQSRGHTQQAVCYCQECACLCQLVEMHEFGWKLDCVEDMYSRAHMSFVASWTLDLIQSV